MKKLTLLESAVLWLPAAQDALPAAQIDRQKVHERVVAIATAAVDAGVPGISIAIGKDSELWFAEGFGYADAAAGERVETDTVFRVGTLAREFTAVGILQLVEAGKLKLDDELGTLLPEFPAWGKKITLEQLLAGTSGVPSWTRITGGTRAKPAGAKAPPKPAAEGDKGERKKDSDEDRRPDGRGGFAAGNGSIYTAVGDASSSSDGRRSLAPGSNGSSATGIAGSFATGNRGSFATGSCGSFAPGSGESCAPGLSPQSPQTSGGQGQERGGRASSSGPAGGERLNFARFLGVEPEFAPGAGYSADTAAWIVLERILERASEQSYAAYVRTRLVEPLELERTTFCPSAKRWIREADDCKQVDIEATGDLPDAQGADESSLWLCSNATEIFRWTSALADRELLGEASSQKMWSSGKLKDGASTGAGYTVTIDALESFRQISHTGGVGGYAVRVAHYPDARATVVVLANCATAPVERMEGDIARALLGLLPAEIEDLPLAAEDVARCAGNYMIATTRIRVFEKDGKLWWEEPTQTTFALLHQGRGVFVSGADRKTRFTFLGEEDDEPAEKVEVLRNGLVSTGQRVAQDGRHRPGAAATERSCAE